MSRRRRKSSTVFPIVVIATGLLLILAAGLWFLDPFAGSASSTPTLPDAQIPYPEIQRVSLADAKAALDSGSAVFLDVRGEPFYSQSHIPGALSIPVNELANRLGELNQSDWIITYCT